MDAPAISVIVPVWNVVDHVGPCLASLRAQSFVDFEAIVVDDGSTDGSRAVAQAAVAGDPRFRLIAQENRGLSGARNAGLKAAHGAFVAFLDSDDAVAPDWLAELHDAICAHNAAWAACAIRLVFPDGGSIDHSAIHGATDIAAFPETRRLAFDDWRRVVPHFPSAWNKLYRRETIAGLTFDEGTWFEDHSFFWRAAARTDHLIHVPKPLYLHRRGRPGQITETVSDRVFDQFAVLDRLAEIASEGAKPGGREALEMIATRLLYERSQVLPAGPLRERFRIACRAWLKRHGLSYTPDWDRHIGRAWGLSLSRKTALSIVIPARVADTGLEATIAALDAPELADAEVLVVHPHGDPAPLSADGRARLLATPDEGKAAAWSAGLAAAMGAIVLFLEPGDLPIPKDLATRIETMLREDADFGFGAYRVDGHQGGDFPGIEDIAAPGPDHLRDHAAALSGEDILRLSGPLSACLFRRSFLLARPSRAGDDPFPAWPLVLDAGLASQRTVYFGRPAVASAPSASQFAATPEDIATLLDRIADIDGAERLPTDWRDRLSARMLPGSP
jgi:glycosyltransferase involved in cell wall biosynthesis